MAAAAPAAELPPWNEESQEPPPRPRPAPEPWQVQGVRAALAESSPALRSHAVQYLAEKGWVRQFLSVQDLQPLLQSADPKICSRAMQALAQLGPQAIAHCVSDVLPLLVHAEGGTRETAVKALTKMGRAALPYARQLVLRLSDAESTVGDAAVHALAMLGKESPAEIVALLRPLFASAQPSAEHGAAHTAPRPTRGGTAARATATRTMLGESDLAPFVEILNRQRLLKYRLRVPGAVATGQTHTRWSYGTASEELPSLMRRQERAVQALGLMGAQAGQFSAPLLLELAVGEDDFVKSRADRALRGLAHQGSPEALLALLACVKEPDRNIQFPALTSLAAADAGSAGPFIFSILLPLIQSPMTGGENGGEADYAVSAYALRAWVGLGQRPWPAATAALLPLLRDGKLYMRMEGATALGHAGTRATPQIISALLPLLEDPSDHVVFAAAIALIKTGHKTAAARARQALWPRLQTSTEYQARCTTLGTLLKMDPPYDPQVVRGLIALLDPQNAQADYAACMATGYLREMGPRLDPYLGEILPLFAKLGTPMQETLLGALTRVGPAAAPRVAREVLPLLQSAHFPLRIVAAETLATLGPPAAPGALPALLPLLQTKDSIELSRLVHALGSMGPAAAPYVEHLLLRLGERSTVYEPDYPLTARYRAAQALGRMGPGIAPAVVPTLVHYLQRSDSRLNADIRTALAQMGRQAAPVITPAMLPLLGQRGTRSDAMPVLSLWGNFTLRASWQCAALAAATDKAADPYRDDDALQALRFHLHLWSGHDPALLLSVRWLGHPTDNPMPARGLSAAEQRATLRAFLHLWNSSAPYPALRREIAQRSGEVAQSISRKPDKKLASLLAEMGARLKADTVVETQPASATARSAVQRARMRRRR